MDLVVCSEKTFYSTDTVTLRKIKMKKCGYRYIKWLDWTTVGTNSNKEDLVILKKDWESRMY